MWTAPCAAAISLVLAGCAGGAAEAEPRSCSSRSIGAPCTSAQAGVEYPFRLFTHCGVGNAYFDGRWWVIEPAQPAPADRLEGTMTLVEARLAYFGGDGFRFAFKPAALSFRPPLCM